MPITIQPSITVAARFVVFTAAAPRHVFFGWKNLCAKWVTWKHREDTAARSTSFRISDVAKTRLA